MPRAPARRSSPAHRSAAPAPRRRRNGMGRPRRARRLGVRDNAALRLPRRPAPRMTGAARPGLRPPPNTISAAPMSPRATGLKPSAPSSPMPTMDSQRGDAAVSGSVASGRGVLETDMARILILGGTTEARQLAGRLAGRNGLDVTLSL